MMNNQVIETILSRKSTRKFSTKQLLDNEIALLIEAACHAPSAHNERAWFFSIVQNEELISELNSRSKEIVRELDIELLRKMAESEGFSIFYGAPTVIIVSGKKEALMPELDCAAATENLLIAAESMKIGACWIGFVAYLFQSRFVERLKKKLQIPDGYQPYYAISLGYPKEMIQNSSRREEISDAYYRFIR